MIFRFIVLIGLCLSLQGTLFSQDPAFEASVDRNPVSLGEQFTLSLTLSNAGMGGGKNLQLPDLSRFHIMSGPNQSSSMQFINGVVSSSIVYSYILQPKDIGKVTLGSASIEAGGKIYQTRPVTIEVVQGSPRQKQQQAAPGGEVAEQIGDNLFLKATADKSNVLQGEQVNVSFKLYTRVSVSNYTVSKNPALTGFWGEDIENPKNINLTTETINGKQYRVGVIRRMALFPTQSGTLEISPMEVQTTVQVQTRRFADPFDAFFRDPFGQTVNHIVKSEPLKIKVEPLPAGSPSSFKGAVGRFGMSTSVDRQTTKTNEPVSLKVTITGTGNIKLLESPVIEIPPDFEKYTPKVSENIDRQAERIKGSKTFEYLVIPRYPGDKSIKPVTFTFFDLSKKEYVTLRSNSIDLKVEQGDAPLVPIVGGGTREDVQMLNQDIRFIKVSTSGLSKRGEYLHSRLPFLLLHLLPIAGFGFALVYARRRQALRRNDRGLRNRRAMKVAKTGLRQAERLLKSDRAEEFHSEVSRAVWKYVGDKLSIPHASLSIDRAVEELAHAGVNGEVNNRLRTLLEGCELARFAPASNTHTSMEQTFQEARSILVELERSLS